MKILKELRYPFNGDSIIANKRKLKKSLIRQISQNAGNTGILNDHYLRVAILGGSTTNIIKDMLELFLLDYGIVPLFYESEYGCYYEEAVFPCDKLDEFKPDIIYIYTSFRNIRCLPDVSCSPDHIEDMLAKEKEKFNTIWESVSERFNCPVIQNNIEMPEYRLLGNYDSVDIHGAGHYITQLNSFFSAQAFIKKNVHICDINYISADFGLSKWYDSISWYMYKYAFCIDAMPIVAFNVANIIKALLGKNKKGFVVDLDNTLWGGVIGDDGMENIDIGPDTPRGQAYMDFQKYLKSYTQLGIILTVNSKNDEETALKGFKHPDSQLSENDFSCIKTNWNSKADNYVEIADYLNVLPESLVFLDDNPSERMLVVEQISGVEAPEINEVTDYIRIIDHSGFFETVSLSEDDISRTEMYRQNNQRSVYASKFKDYGDYLKALDMKAYISSFTPLYMERICQLINKTNQFNLTSKRYTEPELEDIAASGKYITLCGRLTDRFGDNGIISVIIGKIQNNTCVIDSWLMSCRVFKRDMECAMMDCLVYECKKRGISKITGIYIPSSKNSMMENFYGDRGFKLVSKDNSGTAEWSYYIPAEYLKQNRYIALEK